MFTSGSNGKIMVKFTNTNINCELSLAQDNLHCMGNLRNPTESPQGRIGEHVKSSPQLLSEHVKSFKYHPQVHLLIAQVLKNTFSSSVFVFIVNRVYKSSVKRFTHHTVLNTQVNNMSKIYGSDYDGSYSSDGSDYGGSYCGGSDRSGSVGSDSSDYDDFLPLEMTQDIVSDLKTKSKEELLEQCEKLLWEKAKLDYGYLGFRCGNFTPIISYRENDQGREYKYYFGRCQDWDSDSDISTLLIFTKYSKLMEFITSLDACHSYMSFTTSLSPKELVNAGKVGGATINTRLKEPFNVRRLLFKKDKLLKIVEKKEQLKDFDLLKQSVVELNKLVAQFQK